MLSGWVVGGYVELVGWWLSCGFVDELGVVEGLSGLVLWLGDGLWEGLLVFGLWVGR